MDDLQADIDLIYNMIKRFGCARAKWVASLPVGERLNALDDLKADMSLVDLVGLTTTALSHYQENDIEFTRKEANLINYVEMIVNADQCECKNRMN